LFIRSIPLLRLWNLDAIPYEALLINKLNNLIIITLINSNIHCISFLLGFATRNILALQKRIVEDKEKR
jgi:hypothetical protein